MPEGRRAGRLTGLLAAAVPLAALIPLAASASTPAQAATPACAAVPVTAPAGAKIESVEAEHHDGGTVSFPATPLAPAGEITGVPAYCQITVTVTHTGSDHVKIAVALPETGWTGRLQGVGGSAYAAGDFGPPLVQAVKDGYAGVTTDATRRC